ncbi:MAG: hypothetical protein B6226_03340 [Candidatus Cloacimonetes bacterium 4572_65]|nr:MAG: hypothetical protein B6226_03340 [Candidatus Cloacimonetes bacterium 4572_65]
MTNKNYKIITIYENREDLVLLEDRFAKDLPNVTNCGVNTFDNLLEILSTDIFDIAIIYCNIKWYKYQNIINFLVNLDEPLPIFAFINKELTSEVPEIMELGVSDYSFSNPKFSFRLPISIEYIIKANKKKKNALKLEQALSDQQTLFKTLFDFAPDAIVLTTSSGKIIKSNAMFTTLFGYKAAEIEGMMIEKTICNNTPDNHGDEVTNKILKGKIMHVKTKRRHKNGTLIDVSLVGAPVVFSSGTRGLYGIYRDISEEIIHREELQLAMEKAESANIAKSQFLATMSHEIRTPLNGVLGMTQLLNQTKLDEEQKDLLDTIVVSGEILLAIINDVLDFSKMGASQFSLIPTDFCLASLTKDIESIIHSRADEKGLEIEFVIAKDVPRFIKTDKLRLKQILLNLTFNAIKFTDKGKITTTISRSTEKDHYTIVVQDSGIGIKEEDINTLFDPFTQTKNSILSQSGGTGLGLAIVKKIATAMEGKIWVESVYGEGSSFIVDVKFEIGKEIKFCENSHNQSQNALVISEEFAKQYPLDILVAEDNVINQKLIKRLLNNLGYNIVLAKNGLLALNAVKSRNFDLILMDVEMPVMKGTIAMKKIREIKDIKQPYIIAVTANALSGDEEKYIKLGMNDYMSKPIDLNILTTKLVKVHDLNR